MKKKNFYLMLSVIILVLLTVAILFAFKLIPIKSPVLVEDDYPDTTYKDDKEEEKNLQKDFEGEFLQEEEENIKNHENVEDDIKDQLISRESINIINNSPEYEIEMYLSYNNNKVPFLEVEYYIDGASRSYLYSFEEIPSFKKTDNRPRLREGILNRKHSKLYFFIENNVNDNVEGDVEDSVAHVEVSFNLYVLNLKEGNVRELNNGQGYNLGRIIFSPDDKYGTFEYLKPLETFLDGPSKTIPQSSYIQIFDCVADDLLVANNKTPEGRAIWDSEKNKNETNKDDDIYSYSIIKWDSPVELGLKEYSYLWDKEKSVKGNESETNVVFNITDKCIIYPSIPSKEGEEKDKQQGEEVEQIEDSEENGYYEEPENSEENGEEGENLIDDGQVDDEQGASQEDSKKSEKDFSGAVTVLEQFYVYINQGDYSNAYDLLGKSVKFNAFKKIFAQLLGEGDLNIEINKADIDIEGFAFFIEATGMFKDDMIKEIILEEITDDISKLYYYHIMILRMNGDRQELIMPMIATLEKTGEGWKITAFNDGDIGVQPFSDVPIF